MFFASFSATLLSGCSPPAIDLKMMAVDELRVVSLSQKWGWFGLHRKAPCIREIELHDGNGWDDPIVWKATLKGDQQCKDDFGGLVVGKTPTGFMSTTDAPKLIKGKSYFLVVSGIGFGELPFVY
jgi:hypothetical protein